jgi:hypothetical protein
MESHVASSEDFLVPNLHFKPGKSGSYVQESRMVRFQCESANRFSPSSQRLLRFRLTAHNWIDPASVRLSFDLREIGGASAVTLLSPKALSIFNRVRLIAGSTIIEDVDNLARTVNMLDRLKPPARSMNEVIMNGTAASDATLQVSSGTLAPIAASDARTMVCSLDVLGLLSQHKWLPTGLMGGGLVVELELNSDATFATAGSTDWVVENPVIFANEKILDSQLQEKMVQHVLSGKSMPISIKSMTTTLHVVTGQDFTLALARGFSRLDAIILTLYDSAQSATKAMNTFFHPAGAAGALSKSGDAVKLQVQIGSKKYPEYEISSVAEFYMRLQDTLGILDGESSMNISGRQYHDNAFIAALNLEKLAGTGAEYSGINSKEQLLTASWKGTGSANQCYVTLVYSAIVNIKEGGVELLE